MQFDQYRSLVFRNYPRSEILGEGDDWFTYRQSGSELVVTCFDEAGVPVEIMEPPIWMLQ